MKIYDLKFDGGLLERGFWLYVWQVTEESRTVLYIGRTGDSSSRFAASPFSRLGQHLDLRQTATANMLLRNLKKAGLEPTRCSYELFAMGPLYPEQPDLESHRKHRDLVAPLETAIAAALRGDGYDVLGKHPKPRSVGGDIYDQVLANFRAALKGGRGTNKALQPTSRAPRKGRSPARSRAARG